jgi:RNA-directed DNA polymerase
MIQLSPGEGAGAYKLAVVPMNQPNNEGQPSAEAGEGRAQTEENIVQSHMRPTQSGKRMSQGLHGVRQAARDARFAAIHPW